MATSPYFSSHIHRKSEQELANDLMIEHIQLFGQDVLYVPMDDFDVDSIIRDPKNIVFDKHFVIEAYLPQNGDTLGDSNIMSKFGFRSLKQADVIISKDRFHQVTGRTERPMAGDLIFIGDPNNVDGSFMNELFEVNKVDFPEEHEWLLGSHYTYVLRCELWTGNAEKFQTGVPALDQFNLPGNPFDDRDTQHREEIEQEASTLVQFDKNNPLSNI